MGVACCEVIATAPCVTSSFQTECMALVHLDTQHQPDIPVLFLDTGYHFKETYEYRDRMASAWKGVKPPSEFRIGCPALAQ